MIKKAKTKESINKKVRTKKVSSLRAVKKKTLSKNNKKIIKKSKTKAVVKKNKIIKKQKTKRIIKKKISRKKEEGVKLERHHKNPIMIPRPYAWESQAVLNPGAVLLGGKVHLFYRAMGNDGISRIGYASSDDGVNFHDRLYYPVYSMASAEETKKHWPFTSPIIPLYDKALYVSGGGWGGCEDPRAVLIDGNIYLTFNVFDITNGWKWDSMRIAVISINEKDLLDKKWRWKNFSYLSRLGDRQKNWVLFPEKINGKFAVFHNLDKGDPNQVYLTYTNNLDWKEMPTVKDAPDPQALPDHLVAWHKRTRSASAPPIKTKDGWLLLYHAMDKDGSNKYKLGAMLLDLNDPSKVICRAGSPILEPDKWYENDWKPGIIYASGAVVKDGKLFVYYGGGDKYIGVASILLDKLLNDMKKNIPVKLEKDKKIKIKL